MARAAMKRGTTADRITSSFIAEIADTAFGWQVDLDADAVTRAVDPAQAVQARRDTGGPSTHDLDRLFESLDGALAQDREMLRAWTAAGEAAADGLEMAFEALASVTRPGA